MLHVAEVIIQLLKQQDMLFLRLLPLEDESATGILVVKKAILLGVLFGHSVHVLVALSLCLELEEPLLGLPLLVVVDDLEDCHDDHENEGLKAEDGELVAPLDDGLQCSHVCDHYQGVT